MPTAPAVVSTTVALPSASVVDVGWAQFPPLPVDVHVTSRPGVVTATPEAVVSCAVTVTAPPTTGDAVEVVTRYLAGTGAAGALGPAPLQDSVSVAIAKTIQSRCAATRPKAIMSRNSSP